MTSSKTLPFILILALVAGCGGGGGGNSGNGTTPDTPTNNIMSITVNGALCSNNSYVNKPCVSVTICSPGTSTCQTINDILLDTGNYGLRIFRQALTVSLTQQKIGAGSLAECVQYGDGTSEWGPIQMASVVLGNEPAVQVPIQYLDSTFSTIPAMCQNADTSPSQAGFNGILGVGVFAQDCGSSCSTSPDNGLYYSCIGSTCNGTAVPLSSQVQNPVALLPKDNNGVIVKLAGVPVDGLSSVSGTLVLGIGTHSNNIPSAVTTYPTDGSGNFITLFSGISYSGSFIDSGSNGLFFPSSTLPDCSSYPTWFCPAFTTSLSATTSGYTGTPSSAVSFQVGNFNTLLNSSNNVFDDIGGIDVNEFTWGLPFYFGRDVYHGMEGAGSSLGTGPYWAY